MSRLLGVLQILLLHHGVPGFEALLDRAAFEAAARGFDLHSPDMTTWARRAPYRPRKQNAAKPGRKPRASQPESDVTENEMDSEPTEPT